MDQNVQQMMALANMQRQAQPGQHQQNEVDVGACGGAWGGPMQMQQMQQNPASFINNAALGSCNQPRLSDQVAAACQVYRQCVFPVGVYFAVDREGLIYPFGTQNADDAVGQTSLRIFPGRGKLNIFGFKSQIGCGRVAITSVITGDAEFEHVFNEVDACAWNTDNCYCYANWGCFSTSNSFQLQARSINYANPTGLEQFVGTLWCIKEQALNSCGPIPTCGAP